MKHRIAMGAGLAVAVLCSYAIAGEALESGPQVGKSLPGAFHPLNVCNVDAPNQNGKKNCFVWFYGAKPVALIFAREINDSLTSLVKKLDAEVAKNKSAKMSACVVFMSDDEDMEKKVKAFTEKEEIKNVSFGIDNPAGPKAYKIAKEADVTVILYTNRKIESNHAFKKGELNDTAIEKIVGDLPKIVASK